jgi:dipeptidyl aminopeptidase/acylaminoacyl peptidase
LIGGAIRDNVGKVKRANAVEYVKKDAPPFFIAHGEQDPLVPIHQSELLYDALKKAEIEVRFQKIPGAGHGGKEFGTDKMQAAVQEFFDKHLKPKPKTKDKDSPKDK